MEKEFTFIDLFAGIGGFRLALEKLGGKCVFSSEKDKYAQKTYSANFDEIPSGNIKKIENEDIPEHDVLCAGFPCQSFSISGKQKGFEDTRGTLFYEIARIADFHKPKVLLLENVRNLVRHNNGKTFKVMKDIIEEMGYEFHYEVLNASKYGIPQSRKRVFMIGLNKEYNYSDFNFPAPTKERVSLKDILLPNKLTEEYVKDVEVEWKKNKQTTLFDKPKLKPVRIGTINKGGQGERIYDINGHSITLSAYGGGLFSKTGGYKVEDKVRKLSPRECARLMGFPDDFKIPVSDSQAWKQFGNSVVTTLVEKIFKKVIDTNILNNKDSNSSNEEEKILVNS